jgi:hypothetical protein
VSESGQPLLVPETGQLLLGARTRPLGYESRPGLTAGDLEGADEHAIAVGELARSYESPLVAVTGWYRAMRLAMTDCPPAQVAAAYRAAATALEGAGMPGLQQNLLPLALLTLRIKHDRPAPTDTLADWGRYEPWSAPSC